MTTVCESVCRSPQAASPTASGTSKAMAAIRAVRPGLVRRAVVEMVVTRVPSGTAVRRTGECGAGPTHRFTVANIPGILSDQGFSAVTSFW